jgi:hypothetical protein
MSVLSSNGIALVKLMRDMPRGPRREGVFALWLTLRLVEDVLLQPPPPERAMRRRVVALEQRFSSLTLPGPLRRALAAALADLREPRREQSALVLQQLVAPTRDVLGAEAADALGKAARSAGQRVRGE